MTPKPLTDSKVLPPNLWERLLIGGFGGLTPLFMNLIIIDAKVLAEGFTKLVFFGYSVRALALFALGAFWVYLHRNEGDRLTLLQLGILAPALITALINGRNVDIPQKENNQSPAATQSFKQLKDISSLFPLVHAQAPTQHPKEMTGKDGAPMVLVPAGSFTMGTGEGEESGFSQFSRGLFGSPKRELSYPDEEPAHLVELDAFFIDKFEVTTSLYRSFMNKSGRARPRFWTDTIPVSQGEKPVVGVTWKAAQAYCGWAGKRLPTEAEWEKAARGTDGRLYPWGNEAPTKRHANFDKCCDFQDYGVLTNVGSLRAGSSPYGAYDMAGNVWEWVADWYDENYYGVSPDRNPKGPSQGKYKVIRGGSWDDESRFLRASDRYVRDPWDGFNFIGFRCAQDAP